MADKRFGVKEINLIGASSGTPTVESPTNLNLNAVNVAISTNATVGGTLDVDGFTELDDVNVSGISTLGTVKISSGIVTSASGIVTYYGDGSNLTGIDSGLSADADNNLIAGTCAGGTYDPSTGTSCYNVFLGSCAAKCISGGDNNVFIGCESGFYNNNGYDNIFMGQYAGRGSNQGLTGYKNISLGYSSGKSIRDGCYNNFVGAEAGRNTFGGSFNNFFGAYAGYNNESGNSNVAVGYAAGQNINGGSNNVFLGSYAGCTVTTGCRNVAIGRSIQLASAVGNDQLVIGSEGNIWICGDSNFNIYDKDGNQINGGGGVSQNLFRTIAVSGQSDVVADSATDTLTLVAGSNMTITTDANTDTITFASSGSGGSSVSRQTFNGSTSSTHANDADESITITAYKSYSLLKLNVSHPAWVRMYPTTAARTADASRPIAQDPTPGSGVIAEAITTTNNEDVLFTPALIGFNDDSTPSTNVYLAVMNKTGGVQSITVTMTVIQMES